MVPDKEIERRKSARCPLPPREVGGYLKRYRSMVTSASRGAILDDSKL